MAVLLGSGNEAWGEAGASWVSGGRPGGPAAPCRSSPAATAACSPPGPAWPGSAASHQRLWIFALGETAGFESAHRDGEQSQRGRRAAEWGGQGRGSAPVSSCHSCITAIQCNCVSYTAPHSCITQVISASCDDLEGWDGRGGSSGPRPGLSLHRPLTPAPGAGGHGVQNDGQTPNDQQEGQPKLASPQGQLARAQGF